MKAAARQAGFTLVELMITLAVLAIILAAAAPNMQTFLDKNRVVGAAEAIYAQLQAARSEAVKQSADIVFVVSSGSSWCVGFSRDTGTPCNCTVAHGATDACSVVADGTNSVLKIVDGGGFSGVTVASEAPPRITFNGVRGTVSTAEVGNIQLESAQGRQMQVEVNAIGRVRLCSPSGSVGGYPSC